MPVTKSETTAPRKHTKRASSATPQGTVTTVQPMSPDAQRRFADMDSFIKLGVAVAVFTKNHADAGAIAMHGPGFTKALAKQADTNEQIARILDMLGAIGPYSELIGAALPLVMQILVNHERIPVEAAQNFGVVHPRVLEKKVKLEIQAAELAVMQQLEQQEQELERMQVVYQPSSANGDVRASSQTG